MHRNEKFLLLGITLSLLVGLSGFSFAYFVSNVNLSGDGATINETPGDLMQVTYDAGSKSLSIGPNAIPGASDSKTFTVKITPTAEQKNVKYNIKLNVTANTFVKCTSSNKTDSNQCTLNAEELVYTLKRNGTTLKTGDLAGAGTGVITLATESYTNLTAATTYTYTLELTFKNTNADQNHNAGKSLTASVNVEFAA